MVTVKRDDIVLCNLNPASGTEQGSLRPVIVVQIDRANAASPHTIIAPLTTKIRATLLSSHVLLPAGSGGLQQDSVVLCKQVRVIDRQRLVHVWGI